MLTGRQVVFVLLSSCLGDNPLPSLCGRLRYSDRH